MTLALSSTSETYSMSTSYVIWLSIQAFFQAYTCSNHISHYFIWVKECDWQLKVWFFSYREDLERMQRYLVTGHPGIHLRTLEPSWLQHFDHFYDLVHCQINGFLACIFCPVLCWQALQWPAQRDLALWDTIFPAGWVWTKDLMMIQ